MNPISHIINPINHIINPISHTINPISHTNGCGQRSANYKRSLTRSRPQETTESRLKQTTKAKVATFKFFLNFFSALYKFRNVLIVFVYMLFDVNTYFNFNFFFTLAKVVKHKNAYMYNLLFFYIVILIKSKKEKEKKTDLSFSLGKKLKSYATIAPLSTFSLGKGRETLMPQTL